MVKPLLGIQIERNNEDGPTDDRELRKLRKLFWSKTGKGAGRPRKLKVVGVIFCNYQAVCTLAIMIKKVRKERK